jgi:hypothetical protein
MRHLPPVKFLPLILGLALIPLSVRSQSLLADFRAENFVPGEPGNPARWPDDANGNHASRGGDQAPALASEKTPAGQPAVSFDGTQFLFCPPFDGKPAKFYGASEESFSTAPNFSILAVVKIEDHSDKPMTILGGGIRSVQYAIASRKGDGAQTLSLSHVASIARCATPVPTGEWTVIGVTYDGKTASFYQDGQLLDSISGVEETFVVPPAATRFHIGNSLQDMYLTGLMAALRIYEGALTETAMKKDMEELAETYIKQP